MKEALLDEIDQAWIKSGLETIDRRVLDSCVITCNVGQLKVLLIEEIRAELEDSVL